VPSNEEGPAGSGGAFLIAARTALGEPRQTMTSLAETTGPCRAIVRLAAPGV
jgi:hypothetical protein